MPQLPLSTQVELLLTHLRNRGPAIKDDPSKEMILNWVREIPPSSRTEEMLKLLKEKFDMKEKELEEKIAVTTKKTDFEELVPSSGWLRDYIEFTRQTEPPTVFHFFAGLVAIGTALRRNVYVRKGHYSVFPNLCVVIVAPSGKCRKTSACNIARDLLQAAGVSVISDKATPESLVEAFRGQDSACALLYAPELAVFLGKQKYQEGMVPMLTSLFDAPKEWSSLTIGRGELKLTNVALSFLGASTLDWIQTAIPREAFGGGFMSRLLFVIQEDTPRSFPIPPPPNEDLRRKLFRGLISLTKARGEISMFQGNPTTLKWYEDWYNKKRDSGHDERQFAGYSERKPDHLIRLAINLVASEFAGGTRTDLQIGVEHLERALRILDWLELWMPATFEAFTQSAVGEDHERMKRQLKNHGGSLEHSKWLRLNSNKMDARLFRERVDTMRQARLIDFDQKSKSYYLTPEGWK